MTTLGAFLRLARISNLPTVWSNVLAASVLAGGMDPGRLGLTVGAMSAMYTGGMVLNDAFDRAIDERERPERPLPSGAISPAAAWAVGGGLLAAGVGLLAMFGIESALVGLALAAAIVIYDAWHKNNPASPLIMGACRALVYVGTAVAAGAEISSAIVGAALALLLYVAGLTRAAKGGAFQSLVKSWPALLLMCPVIFALVMGHADVGAVLFSVIGLSVVGWAIALLASGAPSQREVAVGLLIAAIALMDAVVAAAHGNLTFALVCVALFVLTLLFQRHVSGT